MTLSVTSKMASGSGGGGLFSRNNSGNVPTMRGTAVVHTGVGICLYVPYRSGIVHCGLEKCESAGAGGEEDKQGIGQYKVGSPEKEGGDDGVLTEFTQAKVQRYSLRFSYRCVSSNKEL